MLTRNFNLLVMANIVLGMSMPILIVLGALAGASLAPVPSLATAVMSVQMLAGIVAASPLSLLMASIGRKRGFVCVGLLTCAGGVAGALAMVSQHFALLCVAHFMLGAALVGVNFIRFAASESVSGQFKANALSLLLASGLVAALLGPSLFNVSKDAVAGVEFSGAYLAIAVLGLLGCLPALAMSEKVVPGESGSARDESADGMPVARTVRQILTTPTVVVAIVVAAISQSVMVLLMVPTPLAMIDSGYFSVDASDVIRWHVVAMFAPGLVTGLLIRRWGAMPVIGTGMCLLVLAAVVALAGLELAYFYISLILLGVGWNFGFIGGTHLLQQSITENERGSVQGINDTILAACGSFASIAAGVLYVGVGWQLVSYVAIALLVLSTFVVLAMSSAVKAQQRV